MQVLIELDPLLWKKLRSWTLVAALSGGVNHYFAAGLSGDDG